MAAAGYISDLNPLHRYNVLVAGCSWWSLQPVPCHLSPTLTASKSSFPVSTFPAVPFFSPYTHHPPYMPKQYSILRCPFFISSIIVTPNENRTIFTYATPSPSPVFSSVPPSPNRTKLLVSLPPCTSTIS